MRVAQLSLLNFAHGVAGEFIDDDDLFGAFKCGEYGYEGFGDVLRLKMRARFTRHHG